MAGHIVLANGDAIQRGVFIASADLDTLDADGVRVVELGHWITVQLGTGQRLLAVHPASGGLINLTEDERDDWAGIEVMQHGKNLRFRAGAGDTPGDGEELSTPNTGTAQARTALLPLDVHDAVESNSSDWRLRFRLRRS